MRKTTFEKYLEYNDITQAVMQDKHHVVNSNDIESYSGDDVVDCRLHECELCKAAIKVSFLREDNHGKLLREIIGTPLRVCPIK